MKSTKIICTVGPSSESVEVLTEMVKHGMNVARLNFSHGTHENHALLIKNVREVSSNLGVPIGIMQDLQGPKIRVGELAEPISITAGQTIVLGTDVPLDYDISGSMKPAERILIEDGLLELHVESVKGKEIHCKVITTGTIRSHKGINLPDTTVTFPIMTEKDKEDLLFGLEQDVDFVALSFVRNKEDIIELRNMIAEHNPAGNELPQIIAKIERPEAVEQFDEILHEVDIVMVARGDLGVEMPDTMIPVIQKTIIRKCLEHAKPVIVATQMLDSMIRNPRPTRAEVSDVANAVIDHADCVMLSGESAFGKYPVETVTEMNEIIEATEESPYRGAECMFIGHHDLMQVAAVAGSTCQLVDSTNAKAIVTVTQSGVNPRFLSQQRPFAPIFVLTDRPKKLRQLTIVWGVTPIFVDDLKDLDGAFDVFKRMALEKRWLSAGDAIVYAAGNPIDKKMNMVEVKNV